MSSPSVPRVAVLVGLVAALSIASAGCMVQDRPEHAPFYVVADAGGEQVLQVGSTAHFEWDEHHAIETEGEHPPEVHLEYVWRASGSTDAISHNNSSSVLGSTVGLTVVGLEVDAEGVVATDAAGALFVPADTDNARKAYVAAVGAIHIVEPEGVTSHHHEVELEGFPAQWLEVDLPVSGPAVEVYLAFDDVAAAIGEEVEGSVIVAVKRGLGPTDYQYTGPAVFASSANYTVSIPTVSGSTSLSVRAEGETASNTSSLAQYGVTHRGEGVGKVIVTESQSLPGFEAAAAVLTVALAALVGARRRR